MTFEIVFVLVAAFGAGFVDAMAGGGGLIQLPALFAAFPQAPHTTLLGTGKLDLRRVKEMCLQAEAPVGVEG